MSSFVGGQAIEVWHVEGYTTAADQPTALRALATGTGNLTNLMDLGSIDRATEVLDVTVYGRSAREKVSGMDSPGDLTLELLWDPANAVHKALANSAGTERTIAVRIDDGETAPNIWRYGMTGVVSSASLSAPSDQVATLTVTISLSQQILGTDLD